MPVRKIPKNYRNLTGIIASKKAIGQAQFESTLERDFLIHLEFSPEVLSFEVQPITIEWRDSRGTRRSYTSDVLVTFSPEALRTPPWLCEVKYRSDLKRDWENLRPKFRQGIRYAKERDWRFRLITEVEVRTTYLDNIRFLMPFRSRTIPEMEAQALLKQLAAANDTTPAGLLRAMSHDERRQAEWLPVIWHLIANHRIGADLGQVLKMDSPIWGGTMTAHQTPPLLLHYGSTVFYRGKRHVIRQETTDFATVVLYEPESGRIEKAAIIDLSPAARLRPTPQKDLNAHKKEALEEAERKFDVIKPLLAKSNRSKKDIQARAEEAGVHYVTLYRWLRTFETTGKMSTLVRQIRKDKGKTMITPEAETIIGDAIEALFLTRQKHIPAKVIEEIQKICAKAGIAAPHPNTIRARIKRLDVAKKTKAREGNKAASPVNMD